jgi:predicted Rossmann fold nucleotide-binding protein DprA/Smf involved in DNA uptake
LPDALTTIQSIEVKGQVLKVIGHASILGKKMTGLLCSQNCPGELILKGFDAVKEIRENQLTVISGFHSPIEKEAFRILQRGTQPIVLCLARNIDTYQIPKPFKPIIADGRMIIIAPIFSKSENRITKETAEIRNRLIFQLSDQVLLIHARPGGNLERTCVKYLPEHNGIYAIPSEKNSHLFDQGVLEWPTSL